MAGHNEPGLHGTTESCRLHSVKIPSHSTLGLVPVDRQKRYVRGLSKEDGKEPGMPEGIPAVINRKGTEAHKETKEPALTFLITLDLVVGGRDPFKLPGALGPRRGEGQGAAAPPGPRYSLRGMGPWALPSA